MVIKSKKDVQKFLSMVKNNSPHPFGFRDSSLSMPNGGSTQIWYEDGNFYTFSQGIGWHDMAPTALEDPEKFVWENRKDINASLRLGGGWY